MERRKWKGESREEIRGTEKRELTEEMEKGKWRVARLETGAWFVKRKEAERTG